MKKHIICTLATLLLFAFLASTAIAAWTVTFSTANSRIYPWTGGTKMIRLVLSVTSDANASGTQTLSTIIDAASTLTAAQKTEWKNAIMGGLLWSFKYSHTGSVTAATVVAFDGLGAQIFSEALATSGAGAIDASVDIGFSVPVTDLKFTSTTLGNGGVSQYEFWIIK